MNYYYYVIDAAGNCAADSSVVSFDIDNLPPQITCAKDTTVRLYFEEPYYQVMGDTMNAKASDSCGVSKIINDFNNLSTINGQKFTDGTYLITWTATDSAGNVNFCLTKITVEPFIIPNFFTPNSDGKNDYWEFTLWENHPDAIVEGFNRWGEKVWTSPRGYTTYWNGAGNNGKPVPDDGYVYVITENGKVLATGSVTIIR